MPQPHAPTVRSPSRSLKNKPSGHLPIGKALRAHGIRGAILVAVDPSVAGTIEPGLPLLLGSHGATCHLTVASVAHHPKGLIVTFAELSDRDHAEKLSGAEVLVEAERLPEARGLEYYDVEIIGSMVETSSGEEMGLVTEVLRTGANEVYVIDGPSGEILVPAVEGVVLEIDRPGRRVVVEPGGVFWPQPDGKASDARGQLK